MKNIKNILNKNKEIFIVIILFLLVFLILLISGINNNYVKIGKLYINELVAKNTYSYQDNTGEYYDFLEIYNGYSYGINLDGYHLSDSEFETNRWTFPNIEIGPQEYLIIFASGKNTYDLEKRICHANFKLSSKGEVLTLTDKNGNIINKFTYPELSNDVSYGFYGNNYLILDEVTPGKENSGKLKYSKISNKELYINEYMSSNQNSNYDSFGKYNDFVELYNNTDKDILLHNVYLTDNSDDLLKYKLPDVTIKKNDYLLIYLADKSKISDNLIFANFKLSSDDTKLILSNGKNIIDSIELVNLIPNVSYGRVNDKWYYFTKPTPGGENNTVMHEKIIYGRNEEE